MSSGSGVRMNSGSDDSSEEQDDSSSSQTQDVEDVLANFREKWQKELKISAKQQPAEDVLRRSFKENTNSEDTETKAKCLFLKGVELEKSGKLYEAIQFYRRAVQLVPDIEFKLEDSRKSRPKDNHEKIVSEIQGVCDDRDDSTDTDEETYEKYSLLLRIQRKLSKVSYLCLPQIELKDTHISTLPPEIILYILRWVVSSDMDVRSLEMFSQVCRGFYLCARDSEIWKSVCERTWGINCGRLSTTYPSWRDMFLERPKLLFNGCYISKTTYIRHGESSFQDQFYRPWHIVAYYRYLRFFPEGIVLMLTTSDEPHQCVGQLKGRYPKGTSVLSGHYRLKDDTVTLFVHRQEPTKKQVFSRNRRRDQPMYENSEQTFHLELKIQNQNRRKHVQLVWTRYSVFTKTKAGLESNCSFDLGNRFPPLWFSRVKSYTIESESPLI